MINNWFHIVESKLMRWLLAVIKMIPNFILAVLVMALFIILAHWLRKLTQKVTLRLSKSPSMSGLIAAIINSIVVIFGFMIALNILKLDKAVTSLLAGVGIIGLALGFAFQDLTANFISGAFMAFKRPFDVGHTVETNGFLGTIQNIELRATTMKTVAGLHVTIPNKDIFQKPIINYTLTDARRIELEFMILNKGDLGAIQKTLIAALKENKKLFVNEPNVYYSIIDDPKVKVYISMWTTAIEPDQYLQAKDEIIKVVVKTLKEQQVLQ
jgi:small-conductance mechanosensitive channel